MRPLFRNPLKRAKNTLFILRNSALSLFILAIGIGGLGALVVGAIREAIKYLHHFVFQIPLQASLSTSLSAKAPLLILGPTLGAVVLFALNRYIFKIERLRFIDPIEANALYGGKLPLRESLIVTAQNLVSNGFGASVGLEAGLTQITAALASKLGAILRLRRVDMRIMVGCGAAAAISAAFHAPVSGAFYALELIVGSFSPAAILPILGSALTASLTTSALFQTHGLDLPAIRVSYEAVIMAAGIGGLCALFGIFQIRATLSLEHTLRRLASNTSRLNLLGGLLLGVIAYYAPMVLSAGHGLMTEAVTSELSLNFLIFVIVMKLLASCLSLAFGFRGGLFFAALLLGALLGKLFCGLMVGPFDPMAPYLSISGMAALAAAIIGGPLTAIFLSLELSQTFSILPLSLAAVLTSSLLSRLLFGYSFATWRLHTRGESFKSPHDIGWVRDLTLDRLMRRDPVQFPMDTPLEVMRTELSRHPFKIAFLTTGAGHYCGQVYPIDLISETDPARTTSTPMDLRENQDYFLTKDMNISEAIEMFNSSHCDHLAVVESNQNQILLGYVSEAYILKKYNQALEDHHNTVLGL